MQPFPPLPLGAFLSPGSERLTWVVTPHQKNLLTDLAGLPGPYLRQVSWVPSERLTR